jgi:flagellar basal-body rod protein FlgB
VDPVSAVLINKALDGLSARYLATAQNVANANSPSFRPLRVTFEESLREAAGRGPGAVEQVTPRVEAMTLSPLGQEMRLDLELATASSTAMRYAALLDLLGRQLQISRIVVRGGQ